MNADKNKNIIDYAIIGNSAAGLAAVEEIRELDKNGRIVIFSEENITNYSKPLITYYLAGKVTLERIYFKSQDFYRKNNAELKLKSKVIRIDFDNSKIFLKDGRTFSYSKLLLANGGKPIFPRIRIDEIEDNEKYLSVDNYMDIDGIFTLTNIQDSIAVKNYIGKNEVGKISILGGGLIGLKSAEAFLEIGYKVNIIELADRILAATFDINASSIIETGIEEKGSSIFKNNTIESIYIKNGRISGYKLRDGKEIKSNLLILAVGVVPDLSFIKDDRLKTGRGIIVDEYTRTSVSNVFAAGDVSEAKDILFDENRNIAIWPLAVRQGMTAGINMAGGKKQYYGGFFMNSVELLGIPSISMGLSGIEDCRENPNIEILKDFKPENKIYKKIVIKNNRIAGIIMIGNIERAGIYSGLIRNKVDISTVRKNIFEENFGILNLPADYKKHLVTGEGIEV